MALIKCPECSKEISDKVKNCPHCGYPLNNFKTTLKEKFATNKKFLTVSILIVVVIVIAVASSISIYNVKNAKIQASNQAKLEKEKADMNILFKDSFEKITIAGNNATAACSIILEVWSNAKGRDFNDVFKYMFSGDIKNHEYSGLGMDKEGFSTISWGSIAKNMNTFKDRLSNLVVEKASVDKIFDQIKQLKKDGREKEIDAIVEYYNSYLKLYNAATNPSGNQLNYSSNLVNMKSELNSNKTKIEMLIK